MNNLKSVYLNDVFAYVTEKHVDKNESYFQFDLFLNVNGKFYNIETLKEIDAKVRNFHDTKELGRRGDVYVNGEFNGIMIEIVRKQADKIDFNPYWMPRLYHETYPVVPYKTLSSFWQTATIRDLIKFKNEYNSKIKKEFVSTGNKPEILSKAESLRVDKEIIDFYRNIEALGKQKN